MKEEKIELRQHLHAQGLTPKEYGRLLKNGKVYYFQVPTCDAKRLVLPSQVVIRERGPRLQVGRDPVLVHKDKGFVVVYKPSGYLSVRAAHRHKDPTIMGFVYRLCGEAHAVHRLDEDTSGLMLVATTVECQLRLKSAIEKRTVKRNYLALVSGHIHEKRRLYSKLVRNRGDGKRGSVTNPNQDFKEAVTHIRPLQKLRGACLIEAQLETGRTHQIRIQLSEFKHPVLGDSLYSPIAVQKKSNRLALHAHTLSFHHPYENKECSFEAPLADDLEKLRRTLLFKEKGKHNKKH